MAWEEDSCICFNMQLIAILSRIGVVFTQSGKNISFLIVPQQTADVTLNITYGNKTKSYVLNEIIKDYNQLESGKKMELTLNVKNGDIQIENPTIGDWGNQGSVDGSIIM